MNQGELRVCCLRVLPWGPAAAGVGPGHSRGAERGSSPSAVAVLTGVWPSWGSLESRSLFSLDEDRRRAPRQLGVTHPSDAPGNQGTNRSQLCGPTGGQNTYFVDSMSRELW